MRSQHDFPINHAGRSCFRFFDVESQLELQAEAMVTQRAARSRRHLRFAGTWTDDDESAFRNCLAELHEARAELVRSPDDEPSLRVDEDRLRAAVANKEIYLSYQPIVDVALGRVVGAEALARWSDDGKDVPADLFIRTAERSDLIHSITSLVIGRMRSDLGCWLRQNPAFKISINIVADDLRNHAFHEALATEIEGFGILPTQIAFELTERLCIDAEKLFGPVNALVGRGYSFHLDDFGRGCSNLAALGDLELDSIKIDRSFTAHVGRKTKRARLLGVIVQMAQAVDISVIVEGVESPLQAEFCRTNKVSQMQGWYLSRPVPPAALKTFM